MLTKIVDERCPHPQNNNQPCRHCSIVYRFRPFSILVKDPNTKTFKSGGLGKKQIKIGEWCDNDGQHFVRDLKICPKVMCAETDAKIREKLASCDIDMDKLLPANQHKINLRKKATKILSADPQESPSERKSKLMRNKMKKRE